MDNSTCNARTSAKILADQVNTAQNYWLGLTRYLNDFTAPLLLSTDYFNRVETGRLLEENPLDSFQSYLDLFLFSMDISSRGILSSMRIMGDYNRRLLKETTDASSRILLNGDGEELASLVSRHSAIMEMMSSGFGKAIDDAEAGFGFHFERGTDPLVAETDRFLLYRIAPTDKNVVYREDLKPVLIIPPFVLGANILAFLPGEKRSYAHAFANMGIPTYIRITRDIDESVAVQKMTGEEEVTDTRLFCEKIREVHGKPVTLNGYCQGGFSALYHILSGKLDGLVDALITCVSPMDGTKSKNISLFLSKLPGRFNDLAYGSKILPSGNEVADGELMGWIYKLKSIEKEAPFVSFYRDMALLGPVNGKKISVNKAAATIHYWLRNQRNDLPIEITKLSFASYNHGVTEDGTLPIRLFGKKLNFKRIAEKKIKWLICYGEKDDLVEPEAALAPLQYVDAEVSAFPRGHVAIATSWSHPRSECALHTRFGEKNHRGPVRYHLDLDAALETGNTIRKAK